MERITSFAPMLVQEAALTGKKCFMCQNTATDTIRICEDADSGYVTTPVCDSCKMELLEQPG